MELKVHQFLVVEAEIKVAVVKVAVTVSFENGVLHIVLPKVQVDADKMVYDIK